MMDIMEFLVDGKKIAVDTRGRVVKKCKSQ